MRGDEKRIVHFTRTKHDLPHHEAPGATYFVRCSVLRSSGLDLTREPIALIVLAALRHLDGTRYHLYDFVIMPDHIHAIIQPIASDDGAESIKSVMYSLKAFTARQINQTLNRRGPVWQPESYDHIIRNRDDFQEKAQYIFWNAHEAGLVDDPAAWPWWGKGSGSYL